MQEWLERHIPKMVLAPSFVAILIFVYGFIGWTAWVSLTRSRLLPKYEIEGLIQYDRLFASPRWDTAMGNLFIFGTLFIVIAIVLGLLIAILLDQKIRTEGVLRMEMDHEPWSGHRSDGPQLGVRKLYLRLGDRPGKGHLCGGYRRCLASVRFRDGTVPRWSALC